MEIYEELPSTFIFQVEHVSFGKRLLVVQAFYESDARNIINKELDAMYPRISDTAKLLYDSSISYEFEIVEV